MKQSYAEIYEDIYGDVNADYKQIRILLDEISSGCVLEIGAGSGRLIDLYIGYPHLNFYLIEPSKEMQKLLNKKLAESNLENIHVFNDLSFCLPFELGTFDLVLFPFAGITEMSPLIFTISEAHRVLKDRGVIYFNAMNPLKSSSLAVGIARSKMSKSKKSLSAENFPVPTKGNFFYEVHCEYRYPGFSEKFIIEQVHPDVVLWELMLKGVGFNNFKITGNFDNESFDKNNSIILKIEATKDKSAIVESLNGKMAEVVYDAMSSTYEEIARGENYFAPLWIKKKLEAYQNLHPICLDLGCATGTIGDLLSDLNIQPAFLFGSDISEKMIEQCRRKSIYSSVAQWDLSCGFPEPKFLQFDLIFAIGVLEFVENIDVLLKDIHQLLKIGGETLLTFESDECENKVTEFMLPQGIFKRFSYNIENLKDMFARNNLSIVEIYHSKGYISPRTGSTVNYWYCQLKKIKL
jgi:SAM-dependent methyltransferase